MIDKELYVDLIRNNEFHKVRSLILEELKMYPNDRELNIFNSLLKLGIWLEIDLMYPKNVSRKYYIIRGVNN